MCRLENGHYWAHFQSWWWIIFVLKRDLIWERRWSCFSLFLVWGAGDAWFATVCRPTLGVGWSWLFSCSTVLMLVSVVSRVVLMIFELRRCLQVLWAHQVFLCLMVQTVQNWSGLLLHGCLNCQSKPLKYWCFQEIILLYLQSVLLLFFKFRLL